MERYNLYLELKNAGFPQGGSGIWMNHPDSNERVYIPTPGEIYATYLASPDEWAMLGDSMAKTWIERTRKHG